MSELRFDRTMSDSEALMWRLEDDPHLSSPVGTVTLLDRAPDYDAFRRRMQYAVSAIPRLRQRVMSTPGNLASPVWVDDPEFDLDRHVRRIACPKPGSFRQVLDLAALFLADPFDQARPLWQFVIAEGLRGGKAALIQKAHHTITDGERGVELSMRFLDVERDAPDPEPIEPTEPIDDGPSPLTTTEGVRDLLTGAMRLPIEVARQVGELLADPSGIPDASASASRTFMGVMAELSDTEPARSPLWTERSLQRRIETATASLIEVKTSAKRLGGTLNTAFLTAAAHAAGQYHLEMGAPVEGLRASMAISTRTEGSGSNAFSLARLVVPTGDMSIAERFAAIDQVTQQARHANESAALDTLATVTSVLPGQLITRIARQQSNTIDFVTSNVRGAPVPLFVAGAEMLENYPVGPLIGTAFNLTLLSYQDRLDMGINIDTAAITDPELLTRLLKRSFKQLAKA